MMNRRQAALALAAAGLSGCGRGSSNAVDQPPAGSLGWAIAGPWRIDPQRDQYRHPLQTLLFWGLEGDMNVLELLPGLGWYTSILAPYLAANGGNLTCAGFDPRSDSLAQRETQAAWEARFMHDGELYGRITRTAVTATGRALAPANSIDLAILANNVHTLMAEGIAERVFREVLAALKPGGAFGVEQHRAASTGLQDPLAGAGYVQEAYVRAWRRRRGSSSSPRPTSTPTRATRAIIRSASGRCRRPSAPRRSASRTIPASTPRPSRRSAKATG